MAKFYVTCGSRQLVLDADSPRAAALAMIDRRLGEHLWIYDDAGLSEQDRRDHLVIESLLHLPTEVIVSERGPGSGEAGSFGVPDLIDEWDRLMTAVTRLFAAAGLSPRRRPAGPATNRRGVRAAKTG